MIDLCMGCMSPLTDAEVCPHCGTPRNYSQEKPMLAVNTELQERYVVGKMILKANDSVQYIGYDKVIKSPVIIREYLPLDICDRSAESNDVVASIGFEKFYEKYLNEFLSYYRTVARLREIPSLISIYDIFTENNTAYTVEDYEELIPFNEYFARSGGLLDWSVARPLLMPLLSAISELNKNGIQHLAINPDSLMISSTGKIKLRGFAIPSSRRINCKFTPDLHTGCSAPEQYGTDIEFDERTDVYGFTATLFYALTGKFPESGQTRNTDSKLLISSSLARRIPPHVITALARGLQVTKERRIPDFESLRAQLSAAPTVKNIQEEITRSVELKAIAEGMDSEKSTGLSSFAWGMIACVVALLVLTVVGIFWYSSNPLDGLFDVASNVNFGDNDTSSIISSTDPNVDYIKIPDLINKTYKQALAMAEEDGGYNVLLSNKEDFSETISAGKIMSQNFDPGTTEVKGVSILITISKGPKKRELPNIKNQDVVTVSQKLGEQGFIVLSVKQFSEKIAEGKVIGYQSFKKGDKVDYGSRIVILISKGPDKSKKKNTSSASSDVSGIDSSSSSN